MKHAPILWHIACRHGFSFMEFYNIKFALQKVLNIHSRILNPYNLMVPNLAKALSLVRFGFLIKNIEIAPLLLLRRWKARSFEFCLSVNQGFWLTDTWSEFCTWKQVLEQFQVQSRLLTPSGSPIRSSHITWLDIGLSFQQMKAAIQWKPADEGWSY